MEGFAKSTLSLPAKVTAKVGRSGKIRPGSRRARPAIPIICRRITLIERKTLCRQ
jgi:hypothetical protein